MIHIFEVREFNNPKEEIWEIISELDRCDWVPGVESISLKEDTRIFRMQGMGSLVERILTCDHENLILEYSAIETPVPIKFHKARISLVERGLNTKFTWESQIDPGTFEDPIRQGMISSLDQLKLVLNNR